MTFSAAFGTLLLLSACSTLPVTADSEGKQQAIHAPEWPGCILPPPLPDSPPPPTKTVYFEFDRYVIQQSDVLVVQDHASYLQPRPYQILIQGSTDERGGAEYNLALGQKRADAVRKAMAALGVAEDRMEAVSLGEEKPKAEGHNEEAWSQNRRAEIVYKAK